MAKQISASERARRAKQSRESNPRKYRETCLKRGCCANCTKNIEAKATYNSGTVFGRYFASAVPGFGGGTRTYRKCAATGDQIVNDTVRCKYYERGADTTASASAVSTALGTR